MPELKATPGPWEFDRHTWWENTPGEQEKHGGLIIYPKYDEDLTIAEVNDYFDKEQGKANAYLITAAPKLLEALKKAKYVLERFACEFAIEDDALALDAIEKAIAKAEGRSK